MIFKNLSPAGLGLACRQNEAIELALSFGFKGMDLDIKDYQSNVESFGPERARRLIDSAKIKLGTFQLPIDWNQVEPHEDRFQSFIESLPKISKLAAEIGCTRAITAIEPASDLRPYHENFEYYRKQISEIAAVLAEDQIQLGLKFRAAPSWRESRAFQFIHSLDALVLLVKTIAAENVGIVFDNWSTHVAGNSIDDAIALGVDRIIAVELSDIAEDIDLEKATDSDRLLAGETNVLDASAVLTQLAELGYEGPVSLAADRKYFEGKNRDAGVKEAGERFKQVWEAAGLNPLGQVVAVEK